MEAAAGLEPDPGTTADLAGRVRGPLILFVGEILPPQRLGLLLQAYHVLVTYMVPGAALAMVGPSPDPGYRSGLESFVRELSLFQAWFPGVVTSRQRAAFFRAATVFVTLSDDDGARVALGDAMAFGVPALARDVAGIREAVPGGGLLLPEESGPLLIAEALSRLLAPDTADPGTGR